MVAAFAESPKEVRLIVKKRPRHVTFAGFEKRKPQPRKELPKLNVGPKLRRTYGQRSRQTGLNSSLDDINTTVSQSDSIDRCIYLLIVYLNCTTITTTSSVKLSYYCYWGKSCKITEFING